MAHHDTTALSSLPPIPDDNEEEQPPGGNGSSPITEEGGLWCKVESNDNLQQQGQQQQHQQEQQQEQEESETTANTIRTSRTTPSKTPDDRDWVTRYNTLLHQYPMVTKSITAAVVQGLGAALTTYLWNQHHKDQNVGGVRMRGKCKKKPSTNALVVLWKKVDWLEVVAFALHGGLMNGVLGHYWFQWLAKWQHQRTKSTTTTTNITSTSTTNPNNNNQTNNTPQVSNLKIVLLDQLFIQPPRLLLMYMFVDLVKAAMREIPPSFKRHVNTVGRPVVNSWRYWPLVMFCTFRYWKRKHYAMTLNAWSLFWSMYLCHHGRRSSNPNAP